MKISVVASPLDEESEISNPVASRDLDFNFPVEIVLVKVGDAERPAIQQDIDDVAKAIGSGLEEEGQTIVLVTHHAVQIERHILYHPAEMKTNG